MPHSRAWASTFGQPIVTISLGSTTCRATSDSFLRSGLTLDLARIERFIIYLRRGRRIGPAVLGFKTLNLPLTSSSRRVNDAKSRGGVPSSNTATSRRSNVRFNSSR